ncbi:MAG TPA: UbiA family prenyltransferase, partial [Solirubrobacterales bacterium]|nr:UbiA family prenyltransferase [Solirubrobacterales bacterium]
MAARPRTLPAAIAPVLVGTAAAVQWYGSLPRAGAFVAALIGSIFIQIGTNLANDYSDARRGADTADRLGPVRVTSTGLVTPTRVLRATWVAFAIAVACGIYLAVVAGVVILVVGA